jgi:peptidoglycan/LPS O-acetylase OafA/YrhL
LGKSSYAFFLVHCGVIAGWLLTVCKDNLLLFFLSCVVASLILYYLVEEPLSQWIKNRTRGMGSKHL